MLPIVRVASPLLDNGSGYRGLWFHPGLSFTDSQSRLVQIALCIVEGKVDMEINQKELSEAVTRMTEESVKEALPIPTRNLLEVAREEWRRKTYGDTPPMARPETMERWREALEQRQPTKK